MPTPTKGARLGGSAAHQKHILANLATSGADDRFDLHPFRLSRFADDSLKAESLEMLG